MDGPRKGAGGAPGARQAFTLVEFVVTIAIIAILASLIAPAVVRARGSGNQIFCQNNLRQLGLAWIVYAQDNNDHLAYNLGGTEIKRLLRRDKYYNWANSLLNWERSSSNTNEFLNTHASLGSYVAATPRIFRCPSDNVLSKVK